MPAKWRRLQKELPSSRRRTVIYGLFDPRTAYLRYVGKTSNIRRRLECHHRLARKRGRKSHAHNWMWGLLKVGLTPEFFILEKVRRGRDENELERQWIAAMRLAGCHLTNRTDGGDGLSKGYIWSEDSKQRLSASLAGRKRTPEAKANMRIAFNRPEMKERRRQIVAELKESNPEWLAKVRHGRTGQPASEEAKAKISASWTPERKARHAAEKSALPVDDRWKEQLAAALASRWEKNRGKPITASHQAALEKARQVRWQKWRDAGCPKRGSPKSAKRYEHDGVSLTLSEWAERTGIKRDTLKARLTKDWSLAEALEQPTSWKPRKRRAA